MTLESFIQWYDMIYLTNFLPTPKTIENWRLFQNVLSTLTIAYNLIKKKYYGKVQRKENAIKCLVALEAKVLG